MESTSERITSTFYGTSSVHIADGQSSVFIDAFLSRPSLARLLFGKLSPNVAAIDAALSRGGVDKLDALFVAHSHHDHVMDAPTVVRMLGGTLYGSQSTLNVGRGAGLDDSRMRRIAGGDEVRVGEFTVSIIEGPHSPGNAFPGVIHRPLTAPSRAHEFKDGGCFIFHFSHPMGSIVVLPSANYEPGYLADFKTDVLFLGIGALGRQSDEFRDEYWANTVEQLEPNLVVPVHWDNFTRPLSRPLAPLPFPADNVAASRRFLEEKAGNGDWQVHFPEAFESVEMGVEGIVLGGR